MLKANKLSCVGLIVALLVALEAEAQIFDRLMGMNTRSGYDANQTSDQQQQQNPMEAMAPMLRRLMNQLQTVNVPAVYDMTKNGSSMGINVLSGLVRVERGQEAERNGLIGPRPLSVRVFGVPVYERGQRVRPPSSSGSEPLLPPVGKEEPGQGRPESGPEEELPIEP